ncbi:hypothetical protein JOF56_001250 [Kibdelosporangium banguiense]|uniref:DUF4307 domain-containing protein n=1 Tax=Kibdelosporangium banguiense TaxID=1365924 RepID=A0ABS4T8W5_9PSEU|nr:DUF4307 domain-containing protein [Kibdelosporangium banguiense]MBP2320865.1 hypothetical protein [Kibdelosporangium banguiense]
MESRVTSAGRELPEGRYGSRASAKPVGRWRRWVLPGAGLLLASAIAYIAYQNLGSAPIEAQRTTFSPVGTDSVKITFTVTRETPSRPAMCVVRARVLDGSEGGRKEVYIPPEAASISTVIKSSGEPVTADVFGCSYDVPPYLTVQNSEARPTE